MLLMIPSVCRAEASISISQCKFVTPSQTIGKIVADEQNHVTVKLSMTVENNGDVDLNPGDEGYSLTLTAGSSTPYVDLVTMNIPEALAVGESKAIEVSGTFDLNDAISSTSGLGSGGSVRCRFNIRDNITLISNYIVWFDAYPWGTHFALRTTTNSDISSLSFGFVNGEPVSQTVRVRNMGAAPLNVTSVDMPDGFTCSPEAPFTVPSVSETLCYVDVTITLGTGTPGVLAGDAVFNVENAEPQSVAVSGAVVDSEHFYEDFEASDLPLGWVFGESWQLNSTASAILGSGNTKSLDHKSANYSSLAITPRLVVEEGDKMVFQAGSQSTSSRDSYLGISYSTDRVNWIPLYTITNTSTNHDPGDYKFSSTSPGYSYQGSAMQLYTISGIPAGEYYIAFDGEYCRIDNVFGFKKADVTSDLMITKSSLPSSVMTNNEYVASVSVRNLLDVAQAADSYTVTLYVGGKAVATADAPEIAPGETVGLTMSYIPHEVGAADAYVEIKVGETAVRTATVELNISQEVLKNDVQVGSITTADTSLPICDNWYRSESQVIYTEETLNEYGITPGTVIKGVNYLAYPTQTGFDRSASLKAYVRKVDETSITSASGTYEMTDDDLVMSDDAYRFSLENGAEGEYQKFLPIEFNEPITYEGGSIVIGIQFYYGGTYGRFKAALDKSHFPNSSAYRRSDNNDLPTKSWSYPAGMPVTVFNLVAEPVRISGSVVDDASGSPVAGAEVILQSGEVIYKGVTDEQGVYSIDVIQADKEYTVSVDDPNHKVYSDVVSFTDGSVEKEIRLAGFSTEREFSLTLNVKHPAGLEFDNASYTLKSLKFAMTYPSIETILSAEGTSVIEVLGGQHRVTIEYPGMRTLNYTFNVNKDMVVDLDLEEAINDPYALDAAVVHDVYTGRNDISVVWNKEQVAFSDDFEGHDAFAIDFAPWTGIDVDGVKAVELAGDYPNRGKAQYAQIINPNAVIPAWDTQYNYTLAPHSGEQYVGFIQNTSGDNNDWLITPQIEISDDNVLRFFMRRADMGAGKLKVGITTEENPSASDFVTISEGNFLLPGYEEWEEVSVSLSEYAGQKVKIGFNCLSENGAMMTMIDDVFVGRLTPSASASGKARRVAARSAANPNEKFVVKLDGQEIAVTEDYSYVIENVGTGLHVISVQAVYLTGMSREMTTEVSIDADSYIRAGFSVSANDNVPTDGVEIKLEGEDNVYSVTVQDGAASVASLPKGSYRVSVNAPRYDEYVSSQEFDADKNIDIVLKETIVKPFNISADVEKNVDGTMKAVVRWNQDLGFSDSFEDYEDFATGSFGGWITIDGNTASQVSYPISIENTIITYPGCSSPEAPARVAPMVFNPFSTVPALAPADEAFMAPDGNKYVAFLGPQGAKADKWLISPQIHIRDSYSLKVWGKAYPVYPETIQFLISVSGTDPEEFSVIDEVVMPYDQWTEYSIDLSEYDGQDAYLAVRCVTNDGFVAQIDKFSVAPADMIVSENIGNVKSYDVSLDGTAHGNTAETSYVFESISNESHVVGIKANYVTGTSEEETYVISSFVGVDDMKAVISKVVGTRGAIIVDAAAAGRLVVTNVAGQVIVDEIAGEGESRHAMESGVYIVRFGGSTFKVLVR